MKCVICLDGTFCEECKTCQCQECQGACMSDTPQKGLSPLTLPHPSAARSQKVKGLLAIQGWHNTLRILVLIQRDEDIVLAQKQVNIYFPVFARPCPVRPRHGFVESRPVYSWESIREVWAETVAADPEGELILTPLISARYNAVWTPTLLTIGRGHDGATSGKDTISIPIVSPQDNLSATCREAGISPTDAPYVEAVFGPAGDPGPVLTQLRAGPPLPPNCSLDFLPRPVKVAKVVKTQGEDLLEWERITLDLMKRDDVIVWHPGGSLTDHFSVHCRERGIPVAITYEPQLGEHIVPVYDDSIEIINIPGVLRSVQVVMGSRPDPTAVLRGVYLGQQIPLTRSDAALAVPLILMGLHFSPVLTGEHGKWIGVASALMCRLGSLACMGEARHWGGSKDKSKPREAVWNKHWNKPLSFHKGSLTRLACIFRYGEFGSVSFGGLNWARCAYALGLVYQAISKLARKQDDEQVSQLVMALNIAVNQAHNGGWWLNKFNNDTGLMDTIQQGDPYSVLLASPLIYEIGALDSTCLVPVSTIERWARWGDEIIKPLPLKEVSMYTVPGIPALQLFLKPRGLFSKLGDKRFVVPYDSMKEQPRLDDRLFLISSLSEWKIAAKREEGDVILWEDQPFTVTARKIINGQAVGGN